MCFQWMTSVTRVAHVTKAPCATLVTVCSLVCVHQSAMKMLIVMAMASVFVNTVILAMGMIVILVSLFCEREQLNEFRHRSHRECK